MEMLRVFSTLFLYFHIVIKEMISLNSPLGVKMCLYSAKLNEPNETHLVMMELIIQHIQIQQGKSEEFDSCDRPCNLAQIRSISIFQSM